MRIAVWNLERGPSEPIRQAQERVLSELAADVIVLTEAPPELSNREAVHSPAERIGVRGPEAWVTISGAGVAPVESPQWSQPSFERMAVAASAGAEHQLVVIYGSVLPWRAAPSQAPELAEPGESFPAMFERVLREQVNDVRVLIDTHPKAMVVWAGDFNQSLDGPNLSGTNIGRHVLQEALDELGFAAWNRAEAHATAGMCAVDLICGPSDRTIHRVERIDPRHDGRRLSDHAGYVVDLL